jgi:hypothetical protein
MRKILSKSARVYAFTCVGGSPSVADLIIRKHGAEWQVGKLLFLVENPGNSYAAEMVQPGDFSPF